MKTQRILVFCVLTILALALVACSDSSQSTGGGANATDGGTTASAPSDGGSSGSGTETATESRGGNPGDAAKNAAHSHDHDSGGKSAENTNAAAAPIKKSSAPKKRVTGGPSIEFDEMRHDFGNIYEGDEVRHSFVFTNIGDEDLIISRVKSSCGCTVAKEPKEPIPPGAQSEIEVVFDSAKRFGEQKKDVSVFSNDPKRPMQKLRVETTVIRQFWVEPQRIYLGSLTKSQELESKKLKVYWSDELDLNITGIKSSNKAMTVNREPFEDSKGKGIELTVDFGSVGELLGDVRGPMQRISQTITITTDNDQFKSENISVTGNIIPEITIRPRVLSFGVLGKSAKPVTKKLIVTAAKDFDLQQPTVESELDFLTFDVKQIRDGKQYQIVATLDPATAPAGQFRKNISIKTNSDEYNSSDIPVFGKIN